MSGVLLKAGVSRQRVHFSPGEAAGRSTVRCLTTTRREERAGPLPWGADGAGLSDLSAEERRSRRADQGPEGRAGCSSVWRKSSLSPP